jgi:hypothetical protein
MIYLILKKIKMTEMTSVGDDFERTMRLKLAIQQAFEENAELLERLGSDYNEDGLPYWENEGGPVQDNSEERLKYMEENGI